MQFSRSSQLVFILVLLAGASLVVFVAESGQWYPRLGYETGQWTWGTRGISNTGWLMPAYTQVSTSYSLNRSLSGFISAGIILFTYETQPGTVMYLGLYFNGQLVATQNYTLKTSYDNPAYVLGNIQNGIANFSNSRVMFTVSELRLKTTVPAGTQITVTAWASKPVWVQIDTSPLVRSYEASTSTTFTPPSTIIPDAGRILQYTLSVGGSGN